MSMSHLQLATFHSTQRIGGSDLLPDTYVIERLNAGELLLNDFDGHIAAAPFQPIHFNKDVDWNYKKLLLVRNGGFGDLLFLTPIVNELKKRWPEILIVVCTMERFMPILAGNTNIDQLLRYPLTVSEFQQFDGHFWPERTLDDSPESMSTHSVDLLAQKLGLDHIRDRTLTYIPDGRELEAAWKAAPRTNRPRIAVQAHASDVCRNWPFESMQRFLMLVLSKGYEVFLFGSLRVLSGEHPNLYNFTIRDPAPAIRESIAFMTTCDVVVAPDSVLAHVAGALEIPCVALYGPFDPDLRVRYAESIVPLVGKCEISPCFHQPGPKAPMAFPVKGPCNTEGFCCALAEITAEEVLVTIERIMKREKV